MLIYIGLRANRSKQDRVVYESASVPNYELASLHGTYLGIHSDQRNLWRVKLQAGQQLRVSKFCESEMATKDTSGISASIQYLGKCI
jgi:hypothetical protein